MKPTPTMLLCCGLGCSAACGDDARESATDSLTSNAPTTSATGATVVPTEAGSDGSTGTAGDSRATSTTQTSDTEGTTAEPVCPADCADQGGVCIGGVCCPHRGPRLRRRLLPGRRLLLAQHLRHPRRGLPRLLSIAWVSARLIASFGPHGCAAL